MLGSLKNKSSLLKIIVGAVICIEDYYTHHIAPQKFETACNKLGILDSVAALYLLKLSNTLTPKTIWQNIKRANLKSPNEAWEHITQIMQQDLVSGSYDIASQKFFGSNLSFLDKLLGKKEVISPTEALKLLAAQAQELFARKEYRKISEDDFGPAISDAEMKDFAIIVSLHASQYFPEDELEPLLFNSRIEDITYTDIPSIG